MRRNIKIVHVQNVSQNWLEQK